MELLELYLLPEGQHLYKDIETVMSVTVTSALMISVESIVESWISTMYQDRTNDGYHHLLMQQHISHNNSEGVAKIIDELNHHN